MGSGFLLIIIETERFLCYSVAIKAVQEKHSDLIVVKQKNLERQNCCKQPICVSQRFTYVFMSENNFWFKDGILLDKIINVVNFDGGFRTLN